MNNNSENKNLIIAMCLFMVVMFFSNYFSGSSAVQSGSKDSIQQNAFVVDKAVSQIHPASSDFQSCNREVSAGESLVRHQRINFENKNINASIDLQGGVIDHVVLKNFKETQEKNSANIEILAHKGKEHEYYYAIFYEDIANKDFFDEKTVWTQIQKRTKNMNSVMLRTKSKNGIVIERIVTLDDSHLINVKDKIVNTSDKKIILKKSSALIRSEPKQNNYKVVHEGVIGNFSGKVKEIQYSKINENTIEPECLWLGYTDIYWLCAIVRNDAGAIANYSKINNNSYKCSIEAKTTIAIAPNSEVDFDYAIYVGPKDLKILKEYQNTLNVDKFDMTIDFGWFFILTKPLLNFLDFLADIFQNMGIVILLLTILFKFLTYPLMKKSLKSAAKMREIQPKISALQELYAGDKMRMNQELVALYKKENVSPMAGCLPMLLQAPVFFCLYKVFFISIKMRHAPLFWWIKDLSAPDSCYIANLFGALDFAPPSILRIGVWPLIMGVTMLLQQKISSSATAAPKTAEAKMQKNMMLIMPIIFTYVCSSFPVGVVIYWTISNIFGIIQQYYINKTDKKYRKI